MSDRKRIEVALDVSEGFVYFFWWPFLVAAIVVALILRG